MSTTSPHPHVVEETMLDILQRVMVTREKIDWTLTDTREFTARFPKSRLQLKIDQYNRAHLLILNSDDIVIGDLEDPKNNAIQLLYDNVQRQVLGTEAVLEDLHSHLDRATPLRS